MIYSLNLSGGLSLSDNATHSNIKRTRRLKMIKFNNVAVTNFLSIGATTVHFDLCKHDTNLIKGTNGAGKSTCLDSIVYALYNKPLRNVKLGQLVNSVNKKKMLVEIDFDMNGKNYKISRGQKPNIFTISVNGEELDQDAAAKDLQDKLENDILQCDFKTFNQVVTMSTSGSFAYFMDLSVPDRRKVVESMLDINVISVMSTVHKDRIKEVNYRKDRSDQEIQVLKAKIEAQDNKIQSLDTVSDNQVQVVQSSIDKVKAALRTEQSRLDAHEASPPVFPDKPVHPDKQAHPDKPVFADEPELPTQEELPEEDEHPPEVPLPVDSTGLRSRIAVLTSEMKTILENAEREKTVASFYQDNDSCDRCNQPIDHEFKVNTINDTNATLNGLRTQYGEAQKEKADIEKQLLDNEAVGSIRDEWVAKCNAITANHKAVCTRIINTHNMECARIQSSYKSECDLLRSKYTTECSKIDNEHNHVCSGLDSEYRTAYNTIQNTYNSMRENIQLSVQYKNSELRNLTGQLTNLTKQQSVDVESFHAQLKLLQKLMTESLIVSADITEEIELCAIGTEMLKDKGLKAKIVQQYLPTINASINKYLDDMGANYSFTLDDNFNETIKSRFRDSFTYGSFSNGEKSRINIAIMMMWRELAKSKNTVSSNLLFIDEVIDSALDDQGIDAIMNLFDSLDDTNIFVISHRKEIVDHFDSIIEVNKVGNFSYYTFV